MLEKLKAIEQRLTEVEQQLSDPAVYGDRERLTALSREQKELTPVVECYRAYLPGAGHGAGRRRRCCPTRSCGRWHRRSWLARKGGYGALAGGAEAAAAARGTPMTRRT